MGKIHGGEEVLLDPGPTCRAGCLEWHINSTREASVTLLKVGLGLLASVSGTLLASAEGW